MAPSSNALVTSSEALVTTINVFEINMKTKVNAHSFMRSSEWMVGWTKWRWNKEMLNSEDRERDIEDYR